MVPEVDESPDGKLSIECVKARNDEYDRLLIQAELECSFSVTLPEKEGQKKKPGRQKKSKSRNLLKRLRDRKSETLLFME